MKILKCMMLCLLPVLLASGKEKSGGSSPNAEPKPVFRFFKQGRGDSDRGLIALVVPIKTTDAQLNLLLRYLQSKVQSGQFAELGISHPTDKRFGKVGYGAGIISIYRGEKCANEQFINESGPCGYGEHEAAIYQWGIGGDPKKDSAVIYSIGGLKGNTPNDEGSLREVF